MLQVMVVDRQCTSRHGLSLRLESEADIQVVAVCGNGQGAVRLAETLHPDVILVGMNRPSPEEIETIRSRLPGWLEPILFSAWIITSERSSGRYFIPALPYPEAVQRVKTSIK